MGRGAGVLAVAFVATLAFWPASPVTATVEMQISAKKLGFQFANCLYCHASPHAAQAMKDRAKALAMAEGNCVACHGKDIPATLNDRGNWLVLERKKRGVKVPEMAWLKDYREPTPAPAAVKAKGRP
jgi:mono/diheme cytochrome c family protein